MRTVQMGDLRLPQLGQGTWNMGDFLAKEKEEVAALRCGIDLGLTVIDTAEMYGDGRSETLVGNALQGVRNDVFLVSKVLPSNASRKGTVAACEASLRRLGTDRIDLYLLHWAGRHPLADTVAAFEELRDKGSIRAWGVSNFDVSDLQELQQVAGGAACAADQVLYNLEYRGVEFDLLPFAEKQGLLTMAYSPVGQGGQLLHSAVLTEVAARHQVTPAQVALAWCLRKNVLAIPKAGTVEHVRQNAAARELQLTEEDFRALDDAYPPPRTKQPLGVL